jgi:hypothetical protein
MGLLIAYLIGVLTAVRGKNDERKYISPEPQEGNCKPFPDRPISVVSVPPALTDQERAKQKKKDKRDNIRFWVEIGTLIVFTIYAGFTIATWWEVKKSTSSQEKALERSDRHFQIDERAWIELEPIKIVGFAPPQKGFGAVFKYNIYPKNVGRTVARDVVVKAENSNASETLQLNAEAVRNVQDKYLLDKFTESGTAKPVIVSPNPMPAVLAPNTVSTVPFTLVGQEPQTFKSGGSNLSYLIGRIDYTDVFHVSHWLKFCFIVVNSRGELHYCRVGNDEDRNGEN